MRYLFLTLFLLPVTLLGQMPADWGAFTQKIDAKPFAGKKFKLQAAVKVQLIDTTAEAEIWTRVDKPNRKVGFFYNMMDKPIRVKDWQVFTIEGTIDKDADSLAFGGLYSRQGVFFFDRFQLFVESSKNQFTEVDIPNGDFETDSLSPQWKYLQKREGFVMATTTETASYGKQAIKVDGTAFKKPLVYGSNDTAGKYANVNGIRLYYEEYGQGEPLLLLHGNSQSILAFAYQIPELSKHYRVMAVDTRGQGKSTEDGKTYSYDLFADDMKAFLDHLSLDSVNVVGWSDGGNTGLIMAMKHPQKVKRLVTMGANIFIDHTVVDKHVFKEINKQIKAVSAAATEKSKNSARLMTMLLTEPNYTFGDLKRIQCPVLVLAGEQDLIKENHTKGIATNIPKGTLLIAPKESHYFPVNNPKSFNKMVLDYLQKAD